MVRHWDTWDDGKRSHPFVIDAKTGEARDLTPKLPVNVPPAPFGGSTDYAFSPDGKTLAFTAEPLKDHPWSTNTDIWTIPVAGGESKNLTSENLGAARPTRLLLGWRFPGGPRSETGGLRGRSVGSEHQARRGDR